MSPGLQRIVAASPGLGDDVWRARIGRLRTAPPFVVHRLWLDRPVAPHRPAFLGTAGHEPLDNISVLERYEREAADWARRISGSVVELHSYAVDSAHAAATPAESAARALSGNRRRASRLRTNCCIAATARCFAPGTYAHRPAVITPHARAAAGR